MNIIARTLALVMVLIVGTGLRAQNFGYVKTDEILAEHPRVKEAKSTLETFQKMLGAKREALVKEFQFKYQDLQQREQQGTITPLDLQKESEALQVMQDSIERYGQEILAKLKEKEAELLQPIIDDVNNAIKLVATENKYTYIFDYASGIILYADETKDLTKLVKAKLGMP